jgi:peptidoglycan/xylan/chitin deacetylase (PgdA/CDA1 family)
MHGKRVLALALGLASAGSVLAGAGSALAGASGLPAGAPIPVHSARFVQDGLELRLSFTLSDPFSPAAMARAGRSLCLLIEPKQAGKLTAQLCLAPPARRSKAPRLELSRVSITGSSESIGAAHPIAATVTRPSTRSLVALFTPRALGLPYRSIHWQLRSAVACAGPAACQVDFYPVRPALLRAHTPRLVGCAPGGGSAPVFGGPSRVHEIALTFDDGPWPQPPSIDFVRLLARYHVPATFFEIGDQISEYDRNGAIERLMLKDGDMIGDHTWTHPDMLTLSPSQQTSQLELTARAIRRATGFAPCLWRPPYGSQDAQLDALASRLGLRTIMWNIDPRDWSLPGLGSIESTVIGNARNGGIVEMHFGGGPRYETYDALPTIITTLRHRGYRFVNLATMLGLKLLYR